MSSDDKRPEPAGPPDPPRRPPKVLAAAAGADDDSDDPDDESALEPATPIAVATADKVSCPACQTTFPITPDVYGAIASCSDCDCEFKIVGPQPASG